MKDAEMGINMEETTLEEMIEEHTWKNEEDKIALIKMLADKVNK